MPSKSHVAWPSLERAIAAEKVCQLLGETVIGGKATDQQVDSLRNKWDAWADLVLKDNTRAAMAEEVILDRNG